MAQRQSQAALRASEERYRSLFENMLNGLAYCRMLFDQERPQDFVYLAVNDAFESLTGLKNVVGKKVSEVIPGLRESDPGLFGDLRPRGADRHPRELREVCTCLGDVVRGLRV